MNPVGELFHRLSDALGGHDVDPDERQQVIDGWREAGGETEATWDKLPQETKTLVEEIEKREPQSWADPADLPHQQNI